MHPLLKQDPSQISVSDRLALIDQLWDSLSQNPDLLPVTEAQKTELDRRLENLHNSPNAGSSWETVKQRLGQRRS